MSEKPTVVSVKAEPARHGVLPGVVHLALDVADKGQATALSVLQDARSELRTAIEHGIDLAEKLSAAAFRFSRKAVQRIDEATSESLASAERLLGGAVKSARETTNAAAQLANTASAGVSGVVASA